jgi:hypothetical protein
MAIATWDNFWNFCFICLNVWFFVPVLCYFCYYDSLVEFEVRNMIPPTLLFYCSITLTLWGPVWVHMIFISFFYFCKECHWNFEGDCMESIDSFQCIAIFTVSVVSIHEHGNAFCILGSFSISTPVCMLYIVGVFDFLLIRFILRCNKLDCFSNFFLNMFVIGI